jgi:hypothetical protein
LGLRRTGREGLHERVVEGDKRRLKHSRAARRADDHREAAAEIDDPEPPSGDDLRQRLISDRVGRFDPSTYFDWKRAREAAETPPKRSRRSLAASAKNAAGKLAGFGVYCLPPGRDEVW